MRRSSITGIACAAAVMIFLSPPSALADDLSFFPSIVATEGDLAINATLQSSEYSQGGRRVESSATFLSERLSAGANGFVYHPRFNVFLARASGALNQWDISGAGSSRSSESTLDYEFRTTFLPEHPYNLELFATHQESASPGTFWLGQRGDVNTQGAVFSYRSYPFYLHMSYNDSSIDAAQNKTDTVVYRVNGTLRGEIMNQTAAYAQTDTRSALAMRSTQEEYAYINTVAYQDLRLYSRLTNRVTDQTAAPDRGLRQEAFAWSEQLTTSLPGNVDADLSYGYRNETDLTTGEAAGPAGTGEFNRSVNTMARLTHHLYRSLVTSLMASRTEISSSLGDITTESEALSMAYTKVIPAGRLSISGQYGRTESEHSGTATVINERHNVPLLGSFTLNAQNISVSTIVIQVKDPPTGLWMTLPRANYLVTQTGRTIQITVLNVSPATQQPDPAFIYEFQASYSLVNQSEIDMVTRGYTLDADIVRDLLSGYFSYSRTEQDVVSGSLAGGPDVVVNEALGLKAHRGPVSGNVEHQTVRSRLTPWEAWKTAVQYRDSVAEDVNLTARASADRYDYLPSASSAGYTATTSGLDAGVDVRFPAENLTFFLSGAYYATRSTIDSDTLSFNSYVTWQKGLLSLNAGAQMNRIETKYATGTASIYSDYVYVNLSRKLF